MTHLVSNVTVLLSLVASVLALLYVVGYAVISYFQAQRGELRPDWSISVVFYTGIVILALAYIFTVVHFCIGSFCVDSLFDGAYLVAILLFLYGFEKRSGAATRVTNKLQRAKHKFKLTK